MGSSISVNDDNFATEVLEKSYEKPVLVDFFAQWCGPCKMLKPMLEMLVQEYDFVLAKVDIDDNPDLAKTYRVEGVPDVRVVVDGQVNPGFVGVLTEPKLREFLEQMDLHSVLEQSLETLFTEASQGNVAKAKLLLTDLLHRYPENRQLMLEAASFYIDADELDTAEAMLAPIQDYEKKAAGYARILRATIQFKRFASEQNGNSDLDQQFQQAVQWVLEQNYKDALEQLLEIVSRDRRYRDDGARKAMLAAFDLLGDENPLTKEYRKQLMMTLY